MLQTKITAALTSCPTLYSSLFVVSLCKSSACSANSSLLLLTPAPIMFSSEWVTSGFSFSLMKASSNFSHASLALGHSLILC